MYRVQDGATIMVEQRVSGTGQFDPFTSNPFGHGRASMMVGSGSSTVVLSAKRYGAAGNDYTVQLIDPGGTYPQTSVRLVGSTVEVRLRRTALGGILATAAEVTGAILSMPAAFPLVADYDRSGAGNGVVAPGSYPLLLGADPAILGNQYVWTLPEDDNGGLFWFEQDAEVVVRQMGASFPDVTDVTPVLIHLVNLSPGLMFQNATLSRTILLEDSVSPDSTDVGFTDAKIPMLPYQAITVTCAARGNVNFYVRRESRFPYP